MADCTIALQNGGTFVVVWGRVKLRQWIDNRRSSGPSHKRCTSSPNHSFFRSSQRNAAVRQTAFRLLLFTLTDSSELICSTSSVWRCFFSVSQSFDVLNITINNGFSIKINRFAALSCSLHPRTEACINQG